MTAQVFRARAELCRQLLLIAKRPDVREALVAIAREFEETANEAEFQRRACGDLPTIKIAE
jgi:hypothetical protein